MMDVLTILNLLRVLILGWMWENSQLIQIRVLEELAIIKWYAAGHQLLDLLGTTKS